MPVTLNYFIENFKENIDISEEKKGSRAKEQKIGDIVEKCAIWRKLFHLSQKLTNKKTAEVIGKSSKNLYYCLHQIKYYIIKIFVP